MAIDPLMYERLSGRKGDPQTRLGEALARDVKAKQERDELPKGMRGGFRIAALPGIWANLWFAIKDRLRNRG